GSSADTLTISGIQVRAINGALLPSNADISRTGGTASISGAPNGTLFGPLSQIVGVAKKLSISQQPSTTATAGVAFAHQPKPRIEDQFGTLRSADTLSITAAAASPGTG